MNELVIIADTLVGADADTKQRILDYYNQHCVQLVKRERRYVMKFTDEWCAAFTSFIAHKTGLTKDQFPYEVSVREQCNLARERGIYSKGAMKCSVGDLAIFDWFGDGGYDHVGIVSKITEDEITTIEGNIKDTVGYRTIKRHSRALKAIITLTPPTVDIERKRLEWLAWEVMRGDHGTGFDRMESLGKDYGKVQQIVNSMLK